MLTKREKTFYCAINNFEGRVIFPKFSEKRKKIVGSEIISCKNMTMFIRNILIAYRYSIDPEYIANGDNPDHKIIIAAADPCAGSVLFYRQAKITNTLEDANIAAARFICKMMIDMFGVYTKISISDTQIKINVLKANNAFFEEETYCVAINNSLSHPIADCFSPTKQDSKNSLIWKMLNKQ